jgi:hypothetical protein
MGQRAKRRQAAAPAKQAPVSHAVRSRRDTVLVNIRLAKASAAALAEKAAAAGLTQKQWITRALQTSGIPIDPLDLEDRTPRRRG